jgi:hypothetical protein
MLEHGYKQAISAYVREGSSRLRLTVERGVAVDDLFVRQMLFSSAETWVAVAYVVSMFTVLTFRPQQIAEPAAMRLSYLLFALYLIVPGSIGALISLPYVTEGFRGNQSGTALIVYQLSGVLGKIFLALSVVFALGSLRRDVVVQVRQPPS